MVSPEFTLSEAEGNHLSGPIHNGSPLISFDKLRACPAPWIAASAAMTVVGHRHGPRLSLVAELLYTTLDPGPCAGAEDLR